MGQMRFFAPPPEKLLPHAIELAYIAGIEGVPWRSCNEWSDGILQFHRKVTESGNLYIPWDIPGLGNRVLSTCTLMESAQPYCLATEIARGTLHRARSLVSQMESSDFEVPLQVREQLDVGVASLIRAVLSRSDAASDASAAIEHASHAIDALCRQYVQRMLSRRHEQEGSQLSTLLAAGLSGPGVPEHVTRSFLDAFHAAAVPFRWRDLQPLPDQAQWSLAEQQLQWCRDHQLRVLAGPLIQLDRLRLPDWIGQYENDYESFETRALRFAQSVVRRFEDDVDVWLCAGRLNARGSLPFTEEQQLRLAVATIETVRNASPNTPVIISFDQPWAEYLAEEDYDLSPLHFADALVRAELGITGVGLELNLGFWPGATLPRDLLEISRHLDRWSLLGIPLIIYLTMPSDAHADPLAEGPAKVVVRYQDRPLQAAVDQTLVQDLIPLLLTKPAVHAIVWNQLSDAHPHEFPCTGLLDSEDCPKPLLESLAAIRKQHLT